LKSGKAKPVWVNEEIRYNLKESEYKRKKIEKNILEFKKKPK
jgi:hypothetical protein